MRPPELRASVDTILREATATELASRRELAEVLAALCAEGVEPLLFKGAALALTHYPIPATRPHLDVDLLITADQIKAATRALERLDYRRPLRIPGELIRSQAPYLKLDRYGVLHTVDLHWKVSKPQVFGSLFAAEELAASAVPVPALGPNARAVGPVHALAIACIHRVAHHHGRDRLIWFYDIHLLAGRLSGSEAGQFVQLAEHKHVTGVCARGLTIAQSRFETVLPDGLLESLEHLAAVHADDPSAAYLKQRMRRVDVLLSDLAALPGWRQRARFLGEHVFPPAWYMRETYGVTNRALLPVLYTWRVLAGAGGWFRKTR